VLGVTGGAQRVHIRVGNPQTKIDGESVPTRGDIIVAMDGQPVSTGGELRAYIENSKHARKAVTVTVLCDGQQVANR